MLGGVIDPDSQGNRLLLLFGGLEGVCLEPEGPSGATSGTATIFRRKSSKG